MTQSANPFARCSIPSTGDTGRPVAPFLAEIEELLHLVNELDAARIELTPGLENCRRELLDLQAGHLEDEPTNEWRLEDLAMKIRQEWIALAHSCVAGEMRSPPQDHVAVLPFGPSPRYIYERVLSARSLERRVETSSSEIPEWNTQVSIFGSGMAAIASAFLAIQNLEIFKNENPYGKINIDLLTGYFETINLVGLLEKGNLKFTFHNDPNKLFNKLSSGQTDVIFLEIPTYDWVQTLIDPIELISSMTQRSTDRPWILVLDTTLLGPMFDINLLLLELNLNAPILILEIRSGLKLDQMGLELSNVGFIRVLCQIPAPSKPPSHFRQLNDNLQAIRKVLGNGLSLDQIAVLDAPWIFEPEAGKRHTKAVLASNRTLAQSLSQVHGLFSRVHHPSLGPQSELIWAESPIVVTELHAEEDSIGNADFLKAVIAYEARRRKLVLFQGASFGFRHHRCEVISPRNEKYQHADGRPRHFFKIAMGSRNGRSRDGVIALLREIAAYPDFDTLRQTYPGINPEKELAVFPDFTALGRLA